MIDAEMIRVSSVINLAFRKPTSAHRASCCRQAAGEESKPTSVLPAKKQPGPWLILALLTGTCRASRGFPSIAQTFSWLLTSSLVIIPCLLPCPRHPSTRASSCAAPGTPVAKPRLLALLFAPESPRRARAGALALQQQQNQPEYPKSTTCEQSSRG